MVSAGGFWAWVLGADTQTPALMRHWAHRPLRRNRRPASAHHYPGGYAAGLQPPV